MVPGSKLSFGGQAAVEKMGILFPTARTPLLGLVLFPKARTPLLGLVSLHTLRGWPAAPTNQKINKEIKWYALPGCMEDHLSLFYLFFFNFKHEIGAH